MRVYRCQTILPPGETEVAEDFRAIIPPPRFETAWLLVTPDSIPRIDHRDLRPTTKNADGSWNTQSGYRWVRADSVGVTAQPPSE